MSVENWDDLIRQAKASGNREIAVPLYERAYQLSRTFAESDPRRAESAFYHAMGLFTGGNQTEAVNPFLEALEHCAGADASARKYQIHQALAAIYFRLRDHAGVESHAKSALNSPERSSDPDGWEILNFLAPVLLDQKLYPEAVPLLEELVTILEKVNPKTAPTTAHLLAFAHHEMGDSAGELRWRKEYLRLSVLLQPRERQVSTFPGGPNGWGDDSIGDFIETARNNEYSTFQQTPHDYARLLALQKRFEDSNRNLMLVLLDRAQEYIDKGIAFADIEFPDAEWLDLYFFMRAHASWLGGVRLALSAQCPEAYMSLRGSLENAQYAFHTLNRDDRKKAWLERHNGPDEKKICRKNFRALNIEEEMCAAHPVLGAKVKELYEETIDRGAHPNVHVFMKNAYQINAEGEIKLVVNYLNPKEVAPTIDASIEIGETVLEIFAKVFPEMID